MGLEVFFEFNGFFMGTKGYCCFDSPRKVLGCMGDMTSVVGFESGFQILRESGVVMGFVSFTC
jgi:hypothetical protein